MNSTSPPPDTPLIPREGRHYPSFIQALEALYTELENNTSTPMGALEAAFESLCGAFGAQRGLLLSALPNPDPAKTTVEIVKSFNVNDESLAAVRARKSAPGLSASRIHKALTEGRPQLVQHPRFLSPADRTLSFNPDDPEEDRNYSAICIPFLDPVTSTAWACLYLQSWSSNDLRKAYQIEDLQELDIVTRAVRSFFQRGRIDDIPSAGRNYHTLFDALGRLAHELTDEQQTPWQAMTASLPLLVEGFGANRALILLPSSPQKHSILAEHNISPEDRKAIQSGGSAPGISSTMIGRVITNRAPELLVHPALMKRTELSAAFADHPYQYSAICAPVLDPTHTSVMAVYYFQSIAGPNLAYAYQQSDIQFLEAVAQLIENILGLRLSVLRGAPPYDYDSHLDALRVRLIRQALTETGNNYKNAAELLGITHIRLYRLIEKHELPRKRDLPPPPQDAGDSKPDDEEP